MMVRIGRGCGRRWAWALAVPLWGAVLLGGCGDQGPRKESVREVVEAQDRARRVKAQADLQAITSALQEYFASNGRFPESLDSLPFVQERHLDTSWYAYDAPSGQVRMRQP